MKAISTPLFTIEFGLLARQILYDVDANISKVDRPNQRVEGRINLL